MARTAFTLLALVSLAATACAGGGSDAGPDQSMAAGAANEAAISEAAAELRDARGAPVGLIALTEHPGGVIVHGELWGLKPGWHGVHIHETGACSPSFEAAGGHFAPDGNPHGLQPGGPHAGDLPNFWTSEDGTARFEAVSTLFSLSGPGRIAAAGESDSARPGLFDADGAAVIVHDEPDDYLTEPAGESGDRIACGEIVRR